MKAMSILRGDLEKKVSKSPFPSRSPPLSLGNLSDGSNSSEPRDLVSQSVHEDGHALRQLQPFFQRVTHAGHDLPHADDGSLLHLLVHVGSTQPLQRGRVDRKDKRSEIKLCSA